MKKYSTAIKLIDDYESTLDMYYRFRNIDDKTYAIHLGCINGILSAMYTLGYIDMDEWDYIWKASSYIISSD